MLARPAERLCRASSATSPRRAHGETRAARAPRRATCSRSPRRGADRRAPRRRDATDRPTQRRDDVLERPRRLRGDPGPSRRRVVAQREHRAVPLRRLPLAPRRTSHGRPARAPVRERDAPAAVHAQVAPDHDATLEAQEQVLADRLDPLEHAPVDRARDTRREPARVRALRLDALADEHLQPRARSGGGCRPRARPQASRADASSWIERVEDRLRERRVRLDRVEEDVERDLARTASVSWPSHSPASGPTATAPTRTRSPAIRRELHEAGRRGRS